VIKPLTWSAHFGEEMTSLALRYSLFAIRFFSAIRL